MRVLLTGATGQVGCYIWRELMRGGHEVIAWSGRSRERFLSKEAQPIDLGNVEHVVARFEQAAPEAVVHAGAMTSVVGALADPQAARQINVKATATLAQLADRADIPLIYCSTDMVFEGESTPYVETDQPAPVSTYGQTKLEAEAAVLKTAQGIVLRLALVSGPTLNNRNKFFDQMLAKLRGGETVTCFEDEWRTPVAASAIALAVARLIDQPMPGLYHLGGPERMSRYDMAVRLARASGVDESLVQANRRADVQSPEPRPRDLSLNSDKLRDLLGDDIFPTYEQGLRDMLAIQQEVCA